MIRKVPVVIFLSLGGTVSLLPLVLGAFGPTVLCQRGFSEPAGIGKLTPRVFRSLMRRRPRVSNRDTVGFFSMTPANPGEFIIAVDGQIIAAARSNGSVLEPWFTCPTAAPVVAFGVFLFLYIQPVTWRSVLRPRSAACRVSMWFGVTACALIAVAFYASKDRRI